MEHLSEDQQRRLRHRLEVQQDELRYAIREELLRSDGERYADLAGQVHDPGEESVADLLSDLNNSVIDTYVRELQEGERALERMHEGTYGICEECGSEIPYARLEAYPAATRCIADQERFERLHGQDRKPTL